MAITVSNAHPQFPNLNLGNIQGRLLDVTWDNNYPAGGEAFAPADIPFTEIFAVFASHVDDGTNLFIVQWDEANATLKVFESGTADAGLDELNDMSAALDGLVSQVLVLGV